MREPHNPLPASDPYLEDGPILSELVIEMRKFTRLLVRANRNFERREEYITRLNRQGKQNYSGDLDTVLDNDILLAGYSSVSKKFAMLAGGLAQVIQAELAFQEKFGGPRIIMNVAEEAVGAHIRGKGSRR